MIRNIKIDRILYKKIFNPSLINSFKEFKFKKLNSYNKSIQNDYYRKDSILTKGLVGQRIFVHNGKEIVSLKVIPGMASFKIGEFFFIKKTQNLTRSKVKVKKISKK
jgi:ribosomal protein S19